MNADQVIDLLSQHQPADALESAHRDRLLAFIRSAPDAFWRRSHLIGHITASAWLISRDGRRVLLVHHRKLDRWLQPGGHIEEDPDILSAALREAREETGLADLAPATPSIFDVDVHTIPGRGSEPTHEHFDIRFCFVADPATSLVISDESNHLRWFGVNELATMAFDPSIRRMIAKTPCLAASRK